MDEKKHGLYKVTDQADRMARLVMDQLAKDGCANLENIRNALMAPLVSAELDHRADLETRHSPGKWLPGHPRPADDFAVDLRLAPGADHMENRGSMHIKCRCPKCRELAERGKAWRDQYDAYVHKVAARQAAAKSDTWHKFRESLELGRLVNQVEDEVAANKAIDELEREASREEARQKAADAIMQPNPIYERMLRQRGMMPMSTGVDLALRDAHEALTGQLVAWGVKADGQRYAVAMNAEMRKAFAAAIATNGPMRVSISDGTYVLPDGEVLTELEMIKRSGTDGRGKRD